MERGENGAREYRAIMQWLDIIQEPRLSREYFFRQTDWG